MGNYKNCPDDWSNHLRTCPRGHRYHASEYGCGECEAITEGLAASVLCECGGQTKAEDWHWQRDGEYWSATCPDCGEEVCND